MENSSSLQTVAKKITGSITFKSMVIGVLILLMLIPVSMVRSLITERQREDSLVKNEISSKWGESQELSGPVIVVPFQRVEKVDKEVSRIREYAYFLPEKLNIVGEVVPEIRYRSLYKAVVYQSDIKVSGSFLHPDFSRLDRQPTLIEWENAFVSIGISDMRGIRNDIVFNWNGVEEEVSPGSNTHIASSGVSVKIPLSAQKQESDGYTFEFDLRLNGSHSLFFTPVGKTTHLEMSSAWETPKFDGAFLPEQRNVTPQGFTAQWNVYNYNRNFPQMWTGNTYDIHGSQFGVHLIIPVDHYQKSERSVKYAIMFIALTFFVFFLVELISRKRIHPLQYLLVSIGLILFYTLLLSLSEHMNFNLAYFLSAIAVVTLITGYSHSIFKEKKQTFLMGGFFSLLYIFLFTVLQMEDLALLIGSIGLFVALAVVMYISRKVDWYHSH
ncbi:MAG: cell envelope integrity protein CreD [Bacteroidales bacterium]|jgi:inner membrane protein|nr:cell envelope integrity protein CreD [Bacteroidales bacterium]